MSTTNKPAIRTVLSLLCAATLSLGCGAEPGDLDAPAEATWTEASEPESEPLELGMLESTLATGCSRSICSTGPALPSSCDPCVQTVCAADPFCCTSGWDAQCVSEVQSMCNARPPLISVNRIVSSLTFIVKTGGDDLRLGSQAYVLLELRDRDPLRLPLNQGHSFAGNSERAITVPVPRVRLGDLQTFALQWDGAPQLLNIGYDNWNADSITLAIALPESCPNPIQTFTPGRMTKSRKLFTAPISIPQ